MFTGYVLLLGVGVVASAVTATFYSYIEGTWGKGYSGAANALAWGHIIFMNIGVSASMLLMIWGGYLAGWAGAAVSDGGLGYSNYQIHVTYLGQLVNPIGALVMLAALGAVLGGLGFIITWRKR